MRDRPLSGVVLGRHERDPFTGRGTEVGFPEPRPGWRGRPDYDRATEETAAVRKLTVERKGLEHDWTDLEDARQKRWRVEQRRDLLPKLLELDAAGLAAERRALERKEELAEAQHRRAIADLTKSAAAVEAESVKIEASASEDGIRALAAETQRLAAQKARDEAQTAANLAERARVRSEAELRQARQEAADPQEALPPELAVAAKTVRRAQQNQDAARARIDAILEPVGGERDRLSPEELRQLELWEQAAQDATDAVFADAAAEAFEKCAPGRRRKVSL